jgi:hypothetical protein
MDGSPFLKKNDDRWNPQPLTVNIGTTIRDFNPKIGIDQFCLFCTQRDRPLQQGIEIRRHLLRGTLSVKRRMRLGGY